MTIQIVKYLNLNRPFKKQYTLYYNFEKVITEYENSHFLAIFIHFILEVKHGFSDPHYPDVTDQTYSCLQSHSTY